MKKHILSLALSALSVAMSAQEMHMQPFKLNTNDSVTLNVAEVRTAYEETNGTIRLVYGYPNSTILTKTDYDDAIANSCGNLVSLLAVQPSGIKRMAFNPQWVYRITKNGTKSRIQIRETNQIFDSPHSYAYVTSLLGNCGAQVIEAIDSVSVANDTLCVFYTTGGSDCYGLGGYNISLGFSGDTLYLTDGGGTLSVYMPNDSSSVANWYTTNGTTDDSIRFARILKTAIWLGLDTTGFIRHQVGLLDGSRSTIYQDSVTLQKFGSGELNYISVKRDQISLVTSSLSGPRRMLFATDTINFKGSYSNYMRWNLRAAHHEIRIDSTYLLSIGYFPNGTSSTWGRGFWYRPGTIDGIRIMNKDGGNTSSVMLELDSGYGMMLRSQHTTSSGQFYGYMVNEDAFLQAVVDRDSDTYGSDQFAAFSNANEEGLAMMQAGKITNVTAGVVVGKGYASSQYIKDTGRGMGFMTHYNGMHKWLWVDISNDSSGNQVSMYNKKYAWKNGSPISTNGIMSFHYWRGTGSGTDPGFITMGTLADSVATYNPSVNIYNSDGSQDDATRLFSITPSQVFGMGNFPNINFTNTQTYEKGFYMRPDTVSIINLNVDDAQWAQAYLTRGKAYLYSNDGGSTSAVSASGGVLQVRGENVLLSGQTWLQAVTSPSSLGSSQNNYTGLYGSNFGRLTSSPSVNLTGLGSGRPGRILPIYNVGSSHITLIDNATSTAANRFQMPTDINLKGDDGAFFIYDSVSLRYRLLATNIGSPYTGSGQLLNGRDASLYMSYMADTTNDVAIGYFTNGTSDDKITYGKFGLHMDGDGDFSVGGKEVYIKGASFDLRQTSYVDAQSGAFAMESLSRPTSSSSSNNVNLLYGTNVASTGTSQNRWEINFAHDLYQGLKIGANKKITGIPSDKMDYMFLYQGGGETGSDTSAISLWVGQPQYTDTFPSTTGTRALSKERGAGVQLIWGDGSGSVKYDILKVLARTAPSDTASGGTLANDGITLYGNSYELPNQRPSSTPGDTSIMYWLSPTESGFILKSQFCCGSGGGGGSVNVYNSDGNLQNGGSEMTMDTLGETLRLTSNLGATTTREMLRLRVVDNAFTRFLVMAGPVDSFRIFRASAGREYTMQSYGGAAYTLASDSTLKFSADSAMWVEGILDSKTKLRYIMGTTNGNYGVRVDGDAATAGDALVSNGTDWVVTSLSSQESNVPSTIRLTLTAKQDNYNPSGWSTTKSQTIRVKADGSFRFATGLEAATRDGVEKTFINDSLNCFGFAKQHADSDADNRFDISRDVIMLPGMSATFSYDSVAQRWKLIATTEAQITYGGQNDVRSRNVGNVIAGSWHFYGQTNGGSITRGSAGNITDSKVAYTQFSTGGAATGIACITNYNGTGRFNSNDYYMRAYTRVRFEDLSSATQDYDFFFGYANYSGIDTLVDTKRGVYVTVKREENSGGFVLKSHDGTTQSSTNAAAVAADTWYEVEVIYYPFGEAACFIDGVKYSKINNVPSTGAAEFLLMHEKDAGTTARLMYMTSLEERTVTVRE